MSGAPLPIWLSWTAGRSPSARKVQLSVPTEQRCRAANIRSFGLGGDSFIGFDVEGNLCVGPERVVPISYLAHSNQQVAAAIRRVTTLPRRPTPDYVEFWFLQREPRRFIQNERARKALDMLRERPMALPELLEKLGLLHPLQFSGKSLLREEIIGRAALTPTDLLHLTREFDPWDKDTAQIAAGLIARLQDLSVDELIEKAMTHIAEKIAAEVVSFITGQTLNRQPEYTVRDDLGAWLFEENLYGQHPYLGNVISLKMPIIGIGAPAAIFLPRVADLLHTDLILPPHYGVANAVGAVAGSVMISREAWIVPRLRGRFISGYYVQAGTTRQHYPTLEEALDFARQTTGDQALAEARESGAVDPHLEFEQLPDGTESYRIRAKVIANPRLGGENAP